MPLCPETNEVEAWLLGTLAPTRQEEISAHLTACSNCELTAQTISDRGDTLVDAMRRPAPPDRFVSERMCDEALSRVENLVAQEAWPENERAVRSVVEESHPKQVGNYRLLSKLGSGGMGTVYRAVHIRLNKVVALKVLNSSRTNSHQAARRFSREMRAAGQLSHPNVVKALDAGRVDDVDFLAMEFVDGVDLSRISRATGQLNVADACEVIRQAAEGIQHLHEHSMVHRDIKPSNLIVTRDGQVRVLDLGLALLQEFRQVPDDDATHPGQVMGTIDYMPPEQAASTHDVDIRADIYSLGATLYRLVTGVAPYSTGEPASLLQKLRDMALEDVPVMSEERNDLPGGLDEIAQKLLARNPNDRFTSPIDVTKALEPFCCGADLKQLVRTATDNAPDHEVEQSLYSGDPYQIDMVFPSPPARRFAGGVRSRVAAVGLVSVASAVGVWLFTAPSSFKEAAVKSEPGTSNVHSEASNSAIDQPRPVAAIPLITEPKHLLEGHEDAVFGLAFFPDGEKVASSSQDGTVRVWDVATGAENRTLRLPRPDMYFAVEVSPDGQQIAAGGIRFRTHLWNSTTGELLKDFHISGTDGGIQDIAFSKSGEQLVVVGTDGLVRRFVIESGELVSEQGDLKESKSIFQIAMLSDDRCVLSRSLSRPALRILDVSGTTVAEDFSAPIRTFCGLGITCDGQSVIAANPTERTIVTWDLNSKKRSGNWQIGLDDIIDIEIFPDGRHVAIAAGFVIEIWNLHTKSKVFRIQTEQHHTTRLAVSPDCRTLVSGGGWHIKEKLTRDGDYRLRVWQIPVLP